jgi:hypothetical protein
MVRQPGSPVGLPAEEAAEAGEGEKNPGGVGRVAIVNASAARSSRGACTRIVAASGSMDRERKPHQTCPVQFCRLQTTPSQLRRKKLKTDDRPQYFTRGGRHKKVTN